MTETATTDEYSHFFEVRLDLFDGPIDLLLHLVKIRELPIERISLAAVTDQYLRCIESAKRFDLDIAGEYLVIAATLLSIKSNLILNQPVELVEDEEGNLVDPHEELLNKLREAAIYKESAQMLSTRRMLGIDVFAPPQQIEDLAPPPVQFKKHDPILLGMAFKKLLEKLPANSTMTFTVESVSIMERMMGVLESLKSASAPIAFENLIPDLTSRASIIGTFLALLELCKRQAIVVVQEETFKGITIALSTAQVGSVDWAANGKLESEFDAAVEQRKDATANG